MEVKQIATLINTINTEILGESAIQTEDLSNIVDVGTAIFNADAVEPYAKALVNHIGKMVFVTRPYSGAYPSILMDAWEFGSVLEKVSMELPEATENESWELENGTSYDPNICYRPTVEAKFFNKRVTFEIPMSFTEKQIKQSFSNATQLNGFVSMIYNAIDNAMTINMDDLISRTVNNMIGETVNDDYGSSAITTTSGVKAVNLLYLYNQTLDTPITADDAIISPEFIRYASYMIKLYATRMSRVSTLFNVGGKARFTPRDTLHIVMLSDFKDSADVYLQSDVFHNELTKLPAADVIPYWQGSGTDYGFDSTSEVKIKTASGDTVDVTGVLAVMFDRNALGVTNLDRRVTTHYNAKAEFYNNWYKFDAGFYNDTNENFVVFFIA